LTPPPSFDALAWAPLDGPGCALVRRDWQSCLADAGLRRADDFFAAPGEALSKPGLGLRYRARLTVHRDGQPHVVYFKRVTGEGWGPRIQRWLTVGRACPSGEYEARVPLALAAAGVAAAEPLAWGWRPRGSFRRDSFVVLAAVPGESMETWCRRPSGAARLPWAEKCRYARALAASVRRLHAAGWCHRDLYLCHVFVSGSDASRRFVLIDLQRAFRPRLLRRRWQVKDLAALNYSAPSGLISRAMRLRFLKAYLDCGGPLCAAHQTLARRIARKTQRIARHDASRRIGS
jgi:hypothetical protein